MIRFLPISPVINWRRFDQFGDILILGILSLGRFEVHTQRLKAEPEVHRCGEFDFVMTRLSEFAPLGNLCLRPFVFKNKPVSMEEYWRHGE